MLEFASQKEKTFQLIPGADVKSVLGEGDDLIQTHAESGMFYTPYHGKARGAGGGSNPYNGLCWQVPPERGTFIRIRIYRDYMSWSIILRDPGAVSRVGRKGATKGFKHGWPLPPMLRKKRVKRVTL